MDTMAPSQANAEVIFNRAMETLEHATVYGRRQSTSTGLTWGYYGGRWGGFSVAAGTHTLSNNTSNYLVVAKATGVASVSTATTNWNNDTDYARAYKVTTASGVVSAVEDHRAGPGGVHYGDGGGGGATLPWFDVTDYGATGDGTTDDTDAVQDAIDAAYAAGGGVVFFPAGVYVIGGALQDTSRSNSQLTLPKIDATDTEQVTIELRGEFAPPPILSVVGASPLPDAHSIIKGTLNTSSGTAPAMIGVWGPSGSFADLTHVHLRVRDLTFRMPSNPVLTACDFSHVCSVDIDSVVIDCGGYYIQGLTEPTTSTSYALRLPKNGNGANTVLGTVNVVGFYKGYQFGEHTNGHNVNAWGCKIAAEFIAADHASTFDRFMAVHCEKVLTATGAHYVDFSQINIEHAASGWWVTDYDIDDSSNYLTGSLRWHVVLAGVGVDSTFTVNGGANMTRRRVGLERAPAVQSVTSAATVTPTFQDDLVRITAQAAGLTLANPTGTAMEGHGIVIRIKDNGTARGISFGTQYRALGVTLPTTTVIGKTLYLAGIWNETDTKLDIMAVAQEA